MSKVWKGTLTFGLISFPCYFETGAREEGIGLHLYHAKCKGPVKRPNFCPECNRQPESEEVEKGYELDTGGYLPITKEDLDSIAVENEKVIEVIATVPAKDVDPVYFNESYWLLPDKPGRNAYGVLLAGLIKDKSIAIARLTKNQREHVLALRPSGKGICIHYLYYGAEVTLPPDYEALQLPAVKPEEAELARQLLENMRTKFEPDKFEDGYQKRLAALIEQKMKGGKPKKAAPAKPKAQPAPDMLAALQASLAANKRKFRVEERG
jgi:DNA end-binding protein Ku